MNPRILKLAKEADIIQWDTLPSGARTPDHESVVKAKKFAELIVRECMEVAHPKLTDVGEWAAGMRLVQKRLKQHFGVEE